VRPKKAEARYQQTEKYFERQNERWQKQADKNREAILKSFAD